MALPSPDVRSRQARRPPPPLPLEPEAAAAAARLRYVSDEQPGYRRRRRGKGFSYHASDGALVTDERVRARIDALAIPPAWQEVWICPLPNGHIQATGRDDAGRKQYVYHPRWVELRDAVKFASLVEFGHALPRLRRRVARDVRAEGPGPAKLVAAAVRMLDRTLVRVGNPSYARANGSYGVTTLRDRHVRLLDDEIAISFRGKSGEKHALSLVDAELAELFRERQELPGYELFRYRDADGVVRGIGSEEVNDYLRAVTGTELTAKEFRTWGASVIAAEALAAVALAPDASARQRERAAAAAVERAATALGNTPSVCRRAYVHPRLLTSFLEGAFAGAYREALAAARARRPRELRLHEAATLRFLERGEAGPLQGTTG